MTYTTPQKTRNYVYISILLNIKIIENEEYFCRAPIKPGYYKMLKKIRKGENDSL